MVINHHQTCTLLDHYHYQVIVNLLNLGFSTKCPLNGITSQFGTHKVAHITSQKQNPNPKLVSATLLCIVVPLSKYTYILDYYYHYYYKNVSGYGPLCLVYRFQYIVIIRLLVACCCLSLPQGFQISFQKKMTTDEENIEKALDFILKQFEYVSEKRQENIRKVKVGMWKHKHKAHVGKSFFLNHQNKIQFACVHHHQFIIKTSFSPSSLNNIHYYLPTPSFCQV